MRDFRLLSEFSLRRRAMLLRISSTILRSRRCRPQWMGATFHSIVLHSTPLRTATQYFLSVHACLTHPQRSGRFNLWPFVSTLTLHFRFDDTKGDRQCYLDFQSALRNLGSVDVAFSECGETGFYSCVEDVETAVSS